MQFHINIEKLVGGYIIESDRLEFKRSWNPNTIYRSICAFSNDFDNIGGGYILIGIEEESGIAKRPVIGLDLKQIEKIQREMIGFNNLIKPYYATKLYIDELDDKVIVILWISGGNSRPYEVPEIINYGGPDRSVKMDDIKKGVIRARRYRNSRIGDFFKEIKLCEGKGTGIPTIKEEMKKNDSPEPIFETDENRTYFITTLLINIELIQYNSKISMDGYQYRNIKKKNTR